MRGVTCCFRPHSLSIPSGFSATPSPPLCAYLGGRFPATARECAQVRELVNDFYHSKYASCLSYLRKLKPVRAHPGAVACGSIPRVNSPTHLRNCSALSRRLFRRRLFRRRCSAANVFATNFLAPSDALAPSTTGPAA